VFSLRSGPAVLEILLVGDGQHLRLVPHQADAPSHLRCDGPLEASLPQQTVDSLRLVPALSQGHFWQECGSFSVPSLTDPLYPDAVCPQLPVRPVRPVLEVAEDGDRHLEVGQLAPGHRTEPGVLHGTGDGVLPEAVLEVHLVEGSNTAS